MNVKAAHEALLAVAREQRTITYGEVISVAGIRLPGDALSGALGHLFYEIVMAELAKDPTAPMLSAVALPKNETRPSKGFFELARELGRLESVSARDEDIFWLNELKAAYGYWGKQEE